MKKFLLATVLLLLCTLVFSQERIAVFPFEDMDNLLTKNEAVLFYRQFSNEFTNKNAGRFTIVPRQDVEKLFNAEEKFQLSDLSAKAKTAETQRVLNGTRILSGVIGKVGTRITISVSLYTFPDLSQLPGGVDLRVANKDELFDKVPELVQKMQNAISGSRTTQTYKIGDTGPAGGIVFYDKGTFSNGWRYLEAAPAVSEFIVQWGAMETDIDGTNSEEGFGKQNTEIIAERLKTLGEFGKAAQICTGMDINGYKDWFLPSSFELNWIYTNLKQKGLGGFGNGWYWSSTQFNKLNAMSMKFESGTVGFSGKISTYSVRAVRSF